MTSQQMLAARVGSKVIDRHSIVSEEIIKFIKTKYANPPHYAISNKAKYRLLMVIKSAIFMQ